MRACERRPRPASRPLDFLAEPRRGRVAQRVRGDLLLDASALGGAADDVGEDRLLEASAGESAEDRVGRLGQPGVAQLPQLAERPAGRGWRRGLPPLPERTSSDRLCPSNSRSRHSSAHSSERRSPVVTRASSVSRSLSARPGRFRSGRLAASSRRRNSSEVSQSRSCRGFGGGSRSRNGSRVAERLVAGTACEAHAGRPRRAVPRRPQSRPPRGEPYESPANRVHRKSPVTRAFSVAGL